MIMWDYYLSDKTAESIISALQHFFTKIDAQQKVSPTVLECDNEIVTQKLRVTEYLEQRGIKIEPSAPYTQDQNGGAERSGGVIKEKIRAMGVSFPTELWPEVCRAAVYLANRTPRYLLQWKTPYEKFFSTPPLSHHLRVYGCKAFALTTAALKKSDRLKRLSPKAWIGYLVGYSSTNLYRIWIPPYNKVIITRDVHFNEEEVFDGSTETLKCDVKNMSLEHLAEVVRSATRRATTTALPTTHNDTAEDLEWSYESEGNEEEIRPSEDLVPAWRNEYTTAVFELLPTPPDTPPECLFAAALAAAMPRNAPSRSPLSVWEYEFESAQSGRSMVDEKGTCVDRTHLYRTLRKTPIKRERKGPFLTREEIRLRMEQGKSIHRKELEPPPEYDCRAGDHSMREWFLEAERSHLESHVRMRSWSTVKRSTLAKELKILDCRWVYVYKFDKHGRFIKCKARLVVRGDQQKRTSEGETYAATLAGRSFKTLVAIATRFDLEMLQYDAVNAFVNAPLDETIYMRMPVGHKEKGKVLHLHKALYGLRKSPLLWQRHFKSSLTEMGFSTVPHEPCCMMKGGVLIFFYVDDIVFAFRKDKTGIVKGAVRELKTKYQLTGGGELQWFLGIQVLRDRKNRVTWLTQTDAIDKLRKYSDSTHGLTRTVDTPMTSTDLVPYDKEATAHEIREYQRRIGSLLYVAITTRPDIAFATSKLSRFLTNPSPTHVQAANRVISYLLGTRTLGLKFGGGDELEIATDASFADDTSDRKSSQGYAMRLFGGLVAWKANKQNTVTTSTTEAELLGLSQTTREALYLSRLLKELGVTLDREKVRIQCDNIQTIRLVNSELAVLSTRLRHVDIHNHWLRQEVSENRIEVAYTPSTENMADGFTKPLKQELFQKFVKMSGLVDIRERIEKAIEKDTTEDLHGVVQKFHEEIE